MKLFPLTHLIGVERDGIQIAKCLKDAQISMKSEKKNPLYGVNSINSASGFPREVFSLSLKYFARSVKRLALSKKGASNQW